MKTPTDKILHDALHAGATASDTVVPGSGDAMRKFADERYPEPKGLGKLDVHGLAELRTIILQVIEDGDPNPREGWRFGDIRKPWVLEGLNDGFVKQQRRDFCDAIQSAIVAKAAPATAQK